MASANALSHSRVSARIRVSAREMSFFMQGFLLC